MQKYSPFLRIIQPFLKSIDFPTLLKSTETRKLGHIPFKVASKVDSSICGIPLLDMSNLKMKLQKAKKVQDC